MCPRSDNIVSMKAVAIAELENHLTDYVLRMEAGDGVLLTAQGRVLAELRKPAEAASPVERYPGLVKLAQQGQLRLGLPNDPSLYPPRPVRRPAGTAVRLLDEERGER